MLASSTAFLHQFLAGEENDGQDLPVDNALLQNNDALASQPNPEADDEQESSRPWHLVRFDEIRDRLKLQHEQADSILTYLSEQHKKATIDDVKSDHSLKRVGLMQGAHVPIPYSTLNLSELRLAETPFGAFASNLVGAKRLVEDNYERLLRVSGTLPMSALSARTAKKGAVERVTKMPGYLKQTATNVKRTQLMMKDSHAPHGHKFNADDTTTTVRFDLAPDTQFDLPPPMARTIHDPDLAPHVEYITHSEKPHDVEFVAPVSGADVQASDGSRLVGTGTEPVPKKKEKVRNEGEQWDLDMQVLEKMSEKLNYLKNPRYDKGAINHTRVLTRPLDTEADLQEFAHSGDPRFPFPDGDHNYMVAQPNVVEFLDYVVDGVYEKFLYIRNATAVSRSITILPPGTQFFSFPIIEFPSKTKSQLAPGMAAKITVRFQPDSLANYEDFCTVLSEGGKFKVKLWAHRPPPKLSIPSNLNVGACLVGDAKRKTFNCLNEGGKARFRMMLEEDWPIPTMAQDKIHALKTPPFIISPTAFDLDHGEAVTLTVDYSPLELGKHERSIVIICDNCHVDKYVLSGSSESVFLRVSGINDVFVESVQVDPLSLQPRHLDFGVTPLGGICERTINIRNDSPLDLPFRWDLRDYVACQNAKFEGWGGRPRSRKLCSGGGSRPSSRGQPLNGPVGVLPGTEEMNDDPMGFEIEPRYGVFPAESETSFTMRFNAGYSSTPLNAQIESVLVVEGVPPSSIPSDDQEGLLKNLAEHGHGQYLRMQAWFKMIDTDGGGTIDRQELKAQLDILGLPGHQRAIRETLEQLDADGDGEITILEFMNGLPEDLQAAIEDKLDPIDISDVQEAIRCEVDCLGFLMRSSSEYVKFSVDPPFLQFPGKLTAGLVYTKEVVLKNSSDVPSFFEIGPSTYGDTDSILDAGATQKPGAGGNAPDMNDYLIDVSPSSGSIEPGGAVTSTVTFSAKPEGLVNLALPVNVKGSNPNSATSCINLSADVIGPRLRINQSEIDFGLVAVGGNKVCTVEFVNEGDVPLRWASVYLSKMDGIDERLAALTSKLQTSPGKTPYGRRSFKARGSSAMSTASSLYSNGSLSYGSGNSPNSFKIDGPSCKLTFDPQEGMLAPRETGKVIINCAAGKLPQRLRATLAFLVSDESKEHDYETQYTSVRAEVQAPKVYLDTTMLNLGVTYTDVPVVRHVVLKNLSNLDTKYKWERPAGASTSFQVDFSPESGSLGSKEVLKCKVTYTAKLPGAIDDIYACRIYGMTMPLGFSLRTISKGVVVGYEKLEDGAPVPMPLCPPDAPQFIGDPEDVPQPEDLPKLHVPGQVALFQRKIVRFVIRNFSACPARFKLRPRKYLPANLEDDADSFFFDEASGATRGSTKGRRKRMLSNHHEVTKVFQTADGQEHTRAKLEYEEDRKILRGGLGFAIDVQPKDGFLEPWGVLVVTLCSYNNMPAAYQDHIHCDIAGAPLTRLDFKSTVVGCPLSLKPTSLGLDMVTNALLPNMKFGEVALGCKPLTRKITVKNSGPIDALLKWSVREPADDSADNKVVALTFNDNEGGDAANYPFVVKLGLYEKPRFESPFDIQPAAVRIPKHSECPFTITLNEVTTTEEIGDAKLWSSAMNVLMVADAQWQHPKPLPSLIGDSSVASLDSRGGGTASSGRRQTKRAGNDDGGGLERETMGAVKLGVGATAISPNLFLDKRRHGEKNAISEVEEKDIDIKQVIKISISAMEYKHFKLTGEVSDDMEQTFLLTNQLSISLDLALTSEGPFKIESAKTMTIPHPNYNNPGKEPWNTDKGRLFRLPPLESVCVSVSFQPKVAPLSDGSRDDIDESKDMKLEAAGRLKIKFSTGQEQYVQLKGELLRPLVAVQPSTYHYGMCHIEDEHNIIVYVNNPTLVIANYKIVHIPEVRVQRPRMILDPDNELNKEHFDDPSVFKFSEYEGSQVGPTLPLPSSGYCLPHDKNRKKSNPVFSPSNMSLTWKSGDNRDLEIGEKLRKMNEINSRNPRAITIKFKPHLDKRYRSRFRFEVEEGSGFDVVLTGRGTYIENAKKNKPPHV